MKRNISETMFKLMDELDMFPEAMMITVQRKDLELLVQEMFFKGDEWSNQSALGYAIKAARDIGLQESTIHDLVGAMHKSFDEKTLDEAAKNYTGSSL